MSEGDGVEDLCGFNQTTLEVCVECVNEKLASLQTRLPQTTAHTYLNGFAYLCLWCVSAFPSVVAGFIN